MNLTFSDMGWYSTESDSDEESYIERRARKFRPRINYSRNDDFRFKQKFRLDKSAAEYVLQEIGRYLAHPTRRNAALSSEQQFLTALAWLGNGSQYHAVGRMHGVDRATVHRCVRNVCDLIVRELFGKEIRWPEENPELIAQKFSTVSSVPFPNVAGLIDGSLIPMDAPKSHEEAYVDRKGRHSLNVLAVCGPNQEFYFLSAKWPGSVHDARVLRNSKLQEKWIEGWRPFPNAVILGDSGFPLSDWLIPPLTSGPRSLSTDRFLRAHKSTRRIVENAFSVWKELFPCLNYLRMEPLHAAKVIMATAVLHNIQKKFTSTPHRTSNSAAGKIYLEPP